MSEQQYEVSIIVNGRPKKVPGPSISFEQVVALAFNPVPTSGTRIEAKGTPCDAA
jgi:hypothetical protein